MSATQGAVAQLGERVVRNDEAVGSIPTSSTKYLLSGNHPQPAANPDLSHLEEGSSPTRDLPIASRRDPVPTLSARKYHRQARATERDVTALTRSELLK